METHANFMNLWTTSVNHVECYKSKKSFRLFCRSLHKYFWSDLPSFVLKTILIHVFNLIVAWWCLIELFLSGNVLHFFLEYNKQFFLTTVEGKKGLSDIHDKSGSTDGFILIKICTLQILYIITMTAYDLVPRRPIEMHQNPHKLHLSKYPFSRVFSEKSTRIKCNSPNFAKKKSSVPIFLCFKCFNLS